MGSNLVIVALPADDDPVCKVSSEQAPHLTLLFLGDAAANPHTQNIISFVEHAVGISEHGPFYLDVDYRGKLGPDDADVLFFRKDWCARWIKQFRNQLLQEPNIKTAFDSADQYEEWTPHLTLGYPAAPAHEDKAPEYGLSMVRFDRIAVWNQDYAGPEFRLEWAERMDELSVAYSAIGKSAVAELLHVSEKPWGDYTKADYSLEQWHAACLIHTHDGAPTSKSECKLPVKTPDGTLNRGGVHAAAAALAGARGGVQASDEQKAKAAKALIRYYGQLGEDPPESLVKHSGMTADELAHHGVKGMKWGQRKAKSVVARPKNNLTKGQIAAVIGFGVGALANRNIREGIAKNKRDQGNFKLDKSWEKDFQKAKSFKFDDQKFTDSYNAKWKTHDFSKEDWSKPSPTYKKYIDGYMKEMNTEYAKQFATHYGSSPSGKYEAHHVAGTDLVKLRRVDTAQHSLEDGVLVTFRITVDDNGLITGLEPVDDSVAQTMELGAEFMAHHGVKGMKWGVRKDRISGAAKSAGSTAARIGKATAKGAGKAADNVLFEFGALHDHTHTEIVSRATDSYVRALPRLKAKHPIGSKLGNRLKNPLSAESRAYRKDAKALYLKHLERAANSMTNVRGTRRYTLKEFGQPNTSKYMWEVSTEAIKHAITGPLQVQPIFDADGYIVDLKILSDGTTQSATHGEIFVDALLSADISDSLAHHGIKGMKWGVHKNRSTPTAVAPHATSRVPHGNKRKTKIQAEGGQNHPAHEDALKVAKARIKLAKSGPSALSNQELRDVANRIQLEQQVTQLTRHGAHKFVRGLLKSQGNQAAQQVVGKQVKRKLATAVLI